DVLPLGRNRTWGAGAKGVTYARGTRPTAFVRIVSDGYFQALGIPLVAGRDFAESDTATSDPVIVINETMAKRMWPGEDPIGKVISPRRFIVLLLGGFAAFALVLAALGIYAVISYSVTQRTQEIGIRMALGASAGALQAQIMRETLMLAAIGMGLGVAASFAL